MTIVGIAPPGFVGIAVGGAPNDVGAIASYLAARHASRVDPMTGLRVE